MSGWVGVVNTSGQPVGPELLSLLTSTLRFRGPDAEAIRTIGCVGLGHTLLRTTWDTESDAQPRSLDGEIWIAGDCRVDGRADLIRALAAAGQRASSGASDAELILHAYAAWGEACPEHLLGDFSFAIFDESRRRVLVARDPLGVRQLFYARCGEALVFSNHIHTLLAHPAARRRLNDLAIADFLIFGRNHDTETTAFDGIRRILPGHRATVDLASSAFSIKRYWTLPMEEPLQLKSSGEYLEQFAEVLKTVVADRLRAPSIGIQMSGGLDSGVLAAAARAAERDGGGGVAAYTNVFDHLFADDERHYAGLTAAKLGIPIRFLAGDEDRFYDSYLRGVPMPDPAFISLLGCKPPSGILDVIAADGTRVAFFGEGPDNLLYYEWQPYLRNEMRKGNWSRVLRDILSIPRFFGTLPGLDRLKRSPRSQSSPGNLHGDTGLPHWLNPDLVSRFKLAERLANPPAEAGAVHPVRPHAYASMLDPLWQFMFEGFDCSVSRAPVEVRHPFLDMRMIGFLLSVPPLPWCRDKFLIRRAMRDFLPEPVLNRPKTGVKSTPFLEIWRRQCPEGPILGPALRQVSWMGSELGEYIDVFRLDDRFRYSDVQGFAHTLGVDLRPRALAFFLQSIA